MTKRKLSAATKRAMHYPGGGKEWFCRFRYTEVTGLGHEVGIHRRDPSSILKVSDLYYVWYTKSIGVYHGREANHHLDYKIWPWDYAEIWYATSADGINWHEQGCAVPRGTTGAYDERTVCTPDAMTHDGKYYLVYQAAKNPYTGGNEVVGMSVADSPDGPWRKMSAPILEPMAEGYWFGENDGSNYNYGLFGGRVHDPMLLFYQNRFFLYYKCAGIRPEPGKTRFTNKHAGRDTRWGVAFSDTAEGPYTHSEYNPITNSGHETLLWKYNGGIAAMLNRDGPEKDTIQFAPDGVNFEIKAKIDTTPWAGGAFRTPDTDSHPLKGLEWGLCHKDEGFSLWNYILRFDISPR